MIVWIVEHRCAPDGAVVMTVQSSMPRALEWCARNLHDLADGKGWYAFYEEVVDNDEPSACEHLTYVDRLGHVSTTNQPSHAPHLLEDGEWQSIIQGP